MLNGLVRFVKVYYFNESSGYIFRKVGPFEGGVADEWAKEIRRICFERGIDINAIPGNLQNYSNVYLFEYISPKEFLDKFISECE